MMEVVLNIYAQPFAIVVSDQILDITSYSKGNALLRMVYKVFGTLYS